MKYGKTHLYRCSATFDVIDLGGVVYHPHYLVMCERARGDALRRSGYPFEDLIKDGFAIPLRENSSEYFRPAYLGEELVILTKIKEVSKIRLMITQEMLSHKDFAPPSDDYFFPTENVKFDEKKLIYRLNVTLVPVKLNPIRATRMPEKLANILELPS